jgi:hypothetical protein
MRLLELAELLDVRAASLRIALLNEEALEQDETVEEPSTRCYSWFRCAPGTPMGVCVSQDSLFLPYQESCGLQGDDEVVVSQHRRCWLDHNAIEGGLADETGYLTNRASISHHEANVALRGKGVTPQLAPFGTVHVPGGRRLGVSLPRGAPCRVRMEWAGSLARRCRLGLRARSAGVRRPPDLGGRRGGLPDDRRESHHEADQWSEYSEARSTCAPASDWDARACSFIRLRGRCRTEHCRPSAGCIGGDRRYPSNGESGG